MELSGGTLHMDYNELCSCCADNRRKINQVIHLLMEVIRKLKDNAEKPHQPTPEG